MVELAKETDFDAIADLNVAAFSEFSARLRAGSWDVMQENLRNIAERAKTAEFMVCRTGSQIIGSVAYCPAGKGDPEIFKPDVASILLLAVHPDHRGKGLAKALTAACIGRARRDQANSVGLFTSELMRPARHLYRSLGFQQEAELPMRHGVRYFRFVLPLAFGTAGG